MSPDRDGPPYKSDPLSFLKQVVRGWWSLGPSNLWFWVVPIMLAVIVYGYLTGNVPQQPGL